MARGSVWPWVLGGVALVSLVAGGRKVVQVVRLNAEGRANAAKYGPAIARAEVANGIPTGLLFRLIQRECRFRSDIISGATRSAVGAIGIAQFMPATAADEGVNPLDAMASIAGAGVYLRKLYRALGNDWTKAVAAYNNGIGNVRKHVKAKGVNWLANAPTETKKYVAEIIG